MPSRTDATLERVAEAHERLKSWRAVARELGMPRSTVRYYQRKIEAAFGSEEKPVAAGGDGMQTKTMPLPEKGKVRRYILTCAQNNTYVHEPTWDSLVTLANHYDAEIMVARFTYNKNAYDNSKLAKPGTQQLSDVEELWYDPALSDHFSDERVRLAPTLVWCGESNFSPTAVRPLSGLESYTGRRSAIFPHTKVALSSVASSKYEGVKLLYTTGCVTLKNYIHRKAGLKAEFHHTYGALLVEVDSRGKWYARQLNSSSDGTIYDLDLRVQGDEVTTGHRVEAITFGDIHTAQLDPEVAHLGWDRDNPSSMMAVLKPREVFIHDLLDFRARNHHDRGNPHLGFEKYVKGLDDVEGELKKCVALLDQFVYTEKHQRAKLVVVQSNHDNALIRWLREADYRTDPPNALIYLTCQKRVYEAIADEDKEFHLLEWILRELGCPMDVQFLREDESYIICDQSSDGIECGMHGHDGANGSRGTAQGFNKMGRRANIGHNHTAQILDGIFVAGTSTTLDLGYNTGPSSWTQSHIVTYPNGKRAIVTMYAGAWRGEG